MIDKDLEIELKLHNRPVAIDNSSLYKYDGSNIDAEKVKMTNQNKIITKEMLIKDYELQRDALKVKGNIRTNEFGRVRFINKKPFSKYGNLVEIMRCSKVKANLNLDRNSEDAVTMNTADPFVLQFLQNMLKVEINSVDTAFKHIIKDAKYNIKYQAYEVDDVQDLVNYGMRWSNNLLIEEDPDMARLEATLDFFKLYPEFQTKAYFDYLNGTGTLRALLDTLLEENKVFTENQYMKINNVYFSFVQEKIVRGEAEIRRYFDYSYRVIKDF